VVVVGIVVLAPLTMVWLSDISDQSAGDRMEIRVRKAAEQAATNLQRDPDDLVQIEEIATRHGVWLRVLPPGADSTDLARLSVDRETPRTVGHQVGALFFGPDGAPTLTAWDAEQVGLAVRPEVIDARQGDAGSRCTLSPAENLLVCAAAVTTPDGHVVHAQESSRRAIRALHDQRYQMAKLTLIVGVMGVLLAYWLGWRMVRPIEQLRAQLRDRVKRGSASPVSLPRDDELGDLAGSFNELLLALQDRKQANEAFAADLVHELKNPIAAVRAAAESLDRDEPIPPERAQRLARILGSSGQRLDALVSHFLELARAEAGLASEVREALELTLLVDNIVQGLAVAERHEGVTLDARLQPGLRVRGATERLETAVANLIDNAAIHARDGEAAPQVQVDLTREGTSALLRVCDSGPGIDDADRERVFERFYTRRRGGTGLGLPLTRAIAEAHGGTVTVETGPLAGACFVLRLPLTTEG